jgi:type IV secretion system protein VirB9
MNRTKNNPTLPAALLLSASLAACATAPNNSVPPAPDNAKPSAETFVPATLADDTPKTIEIVEVPTPLPLPGQLKPNPKAQSVAKKTATGAPAVLSGTTAARVEPDGGRFLNAIQVYDYAPGALYQVYAAPGQVTDVALQPGEALVDVSAGDTLRWVLGDTTSGTGTDRRTHILIKPTASGLATNLVVTTDRRAYHVELRSTDGTYMAALSWRHPQDELRALRGQAAAAEQQAASTVADNVNLASLSFAYRITGDRPAWRPLRAFDDGTRTYVQMPEGGEAAVRPPLFVMTDEDEPSLVNYRMRGDAYVVDGLFNAAELRLGGKRQQRVRIERTGGRR